MRKTLTLALDDSWQRWNVTHRYLAVTGSVLRQLAKLQHCTFTVYPEISVPSAAGKGGRIHYHGELKIKDYISFLVDDLSVIYELGKFSEVDDLNDPEKWSEYCAKQRVEMEAYCAKLGVPYKLTNDTKYDEGRKGKAPMLLKKIHQPAF